MDETLYLTVNLIDRFLALQPVVRKKLQLVGVTAMLLACKYEEVSVPVVEDLVLISDKAYSRKEVLDMVVHINHIYTIQINATRNFHNFFNSFFLWVYAGKVDGQYVAVQYVVANALRVREALLESRSI